MQHLAIHGDVSLAIMHVQKTYTTVPLKRQTMNSWHRKMREQALSNTNNDDRDTSLEAFDRHHSPANEKPKGGSITSKGDQEFLQSVLKSRDERNVGMSRKELICVIAEITRVPHKTAENHLDYLIRAKKLPELKRGGRVVRAQPTTTNRTAVTTEKLLRTHTSQEEGESFLGVIT
jgi:hypothetical protein